VIVSYVEAASRASGDAVRTTSRQARGGERMLGKPATPDRQWPSIAVSRGTLRGCGIGKEIVFEAKTIRLPDGAATLN